MASNVVLKIGGSLLFDNMTLNVERVQNFAQFVISQPAIKAIVVGGGEMARLYIDGDRALGASEADCDLMGIGITRLNGQLLIQALGERAFPLVPHSIEEFAQAQVTGKIVVVAGFTPGQSTTSVSLIVAEYLHADLLLVLTDVDGIYDRDPRKFPDATRFSTITIGELQEILQQGAGARQAAAGEYRIFDPVSIEIVKRSAVPVQLTSGKDLDQVAQLIADPDADVGTKITR
jgi:uridylate kinase